MTEDEAKNKYCPLMPLNKEIGNRCIASDCMMWVWDTHEYHQEKKVKGLTGHCGMVKS